LTLLLAYWYIVSPRRWAYDVGFLIVVAAPIVQHVFARIYVSPDPGLRIGDALGHLMWIRLGIAALFIERGWYPGDFGFWPTAKEWMLGTLWFAIAAIPLCALGLSIGMIRFAPLDRPWWQAAGIVMGTFFGVLWVVALSEELFFRGVIEKFFLNRWKSPVAAIAISAVLYGCSHLWYRAFPNWREALVTAALGVACGIVYARTDSVRAPMVTHALAAVTVRALFRYT
jgi:membrane protease YdiL (CAAX protease family)